MMLQSACPVLSNYPTSDEWKSYPVQLRTECMKRVKHNRKIEKKKQSNYERKAEHKETIVEIFLVGRYHMKKPAPILNRKMGRKKNSACNLNEAGICHVEYKIYDVIPIQSNRIRRRLAEHQNIWQRAPKI